MSKFRSYADRVNKIAQESFEAYTAAEAALKNAEAKAKKYPQRHGAVDYEYAAKSARAQADLMEAREAVHRAQGQMVARNSEIAAIRRELAAALDAEYAADPTQIDANTITLLQSGILSATEYARMLHNAQESGNLTMGRIIGKYAGDFAKQLEGQFGQEQKASELRAIALESGINDASSKLDAFDVMAEAFQRTSNNTSMIGCWEELTAPVVELF